ncbi:redox-sensing transcriptional repressor Rex, partial [bacterium]|nr:redox-sensing transcriptional repressor Rex [bacterium]
INKLQRVIVVGVGNIGEALLSYQDWPARGFEIAGAFDKDKRKMGRVINGIEVRGNSEVPSFVKKEGIEIAILSTPTEITQLKVNELAQDGMRGFYVFSPIVINVPVGCYVENIDMISPLEFLVYRLKNKISK